MNRLTVMLVGGILMVGCDKEAAPPDLKTGEQLYNYYCAECHQGSGDGSFLKGVPPLRYTNLTHGQLVDLILGHEKPEGSRMPEFKINEQQAEAIATYIRRNLRAD